MRIGGDVLVEWGGALRWLRTDASAGTPRCFRAAIGPATCTTYLLFGDEFDGPRRGRIYLIKQLLEGARVIARIRTHLDRCLTCRACETTCPWGARYGRLAVGRIGRRVLALGGRVQGKIAPEIERRRRESSTGWASATSRCRSPDAASHHLSARDAAPEHRRMVAGNRSRGRGGRHYSERVRGRGQGVRGAPGARSGVRGEGGARLSACAGPERGGGGRGLLRLRARTRARAESRSTPRTPCSTGRSRVASVPVRHWVQLMDPGEER